MASTPLPEHVSGVSIAADTPVPLLPQPRARRGGQLHVVRTVRPDPRVWRTALRLAGGDVHRCRVQPDGSVIVANV